MKKNQKRWVFGSTKAPNVKPTEQEKQHINEFFEPLINAFKKQFVKENPNKDYNYVTDVYSKWYQNFFYLCEKFKAEHPNRIADEYEAKFVRLKYTGKDQFEFSYFRHTGQWHLVTSGLPLEQCKEMILENPAFQPMNA